MAEAGPPVIPLPERHYRHVAFVRIAHWINALCILALLPTGLDILGHHPELYWGETGFFGDRYFLSFGKEESDYLGIGIGAARSMHFIAAWILVFNAAFFLALGLAGGHITRDLLPDRDQLALANVQRSIVDHLLLRHDRQDAARRYNLIQKLAYLIVLFVFGPMIVLTGLAMSPAVSTQFPFLIEIFGGRQTARSLHFLVAASFLAFLLVHLWQVWLVGWRREVRVMVTGWHSVDRPSDAGGSVP